MFISTKNLLTGIAVMALSASCAFAQTFSATLEGAQSVPPVSSTGTGSVVAVLTGTTLVLSGSFSNLEGSYSAAHIHNALMGDTGGVMFGLTPTFVDAHTGSFEAMDNTFTLSAGQVTAIMSHRFYVNVHTTLYGAGEIRGQLMMMTTAAADDIPSAFELSDAYPNPFNPSTTISFTLEETANVSLSVFDIAGRSVATLADGLLSSGAHSVVFDASALSSGIYYYTLEANGSTQTRKMTLLK